jgi:ribonuclease VapC
VYFVVVDTSALLAVLFQEADADFYAEKLASGDRKLITPFNALEAEIVLEARKGSEGRRELDLLFYHSMIDIVPFDRAMSSLGAEAWRRFGKGNHPAGLNLGDCCAYALSVYTHEPLLFKGEDFAKTDVQAAG